MFNPFLPGFLSAASIIWKNGHSSRMNDGGNYVNWPASATQGWAVPMLCAAAASIITGIALVATRYVVQQADGLTVAMLRYCVATACLLPMAMIFYWVKVAKKDFFVIAALGVLYFGIFPWCISSAMQFTTASAGSIVLACTPAVTLILAGLWGSEVMTARKCLGVTLAIIGAGIAIGGAMIALAAASWYGHALMIAATVCGAVYAVFSKPYLNKYPPIVVSAIAMGAGAASLLCVWFVRDLPSGWPELNAKGWLVIVFIGAIGGALSFFLYAWALGRTAPTATMILLPLNPMAAIFTGVMFLGEPLTSGLFVGLALVIFGIFLVIDMTGGTKSSVMVAAKVNHEIPPA
jgi:drug/metabolite transporter (DMT)-like permease